MGLRSPPAAASALDQQRRLQLRPQRAAADSGEIVVVIRVRQAIQVLNPIWGRRKFRLTVLAINHTWHFFDRMASRQSLDEGRKTVVRLAGTDKIDPWKLPVQLQAHDTFAVPAPKDDQFALVSALDRM